MEYTKVKLLCLNVNLTVLRSLAQAKEILGEVRRQETTLSFSTSPTERAVFSPQDGGEWSIWEPDTAMGIDPVFQPSMIVDEEIAYKRLFQLRKHYNAKWRDYK